MGYLFKITVGSKNTNSKELSANHFPTAFFGAKLGKIYNPCNYESEMGTFSRLRSDDGTRAVFTNEAYGTSDVSNELESGVSVNVIRVQDSIEQIRTPRI